MASQTGGLLFIEEDDWINCYIVDNAGKQILVSTMRTGTYYNDIECAQAWEDAMCNHIKFLIKRICGKETKITETMVDDSLHKTFDA